MRSKNIYFLRVKVLFTLLMSTNLLLAQVSSVENFKSALAFTDSVIERSKSNVLSEHGFSGRIESFAEKIKGKIFLDSSETEIKYVQLFDIQRNEKIEYYTLANELVLVIEVNRIFLIYNNEFYTFSQSEGISKCIESDMKRHIEFFNSLKAVWL